MGSLGFNVMLGLLGGNEESVKAFNSGVGKTIVSLSIGDDNALHFAFEDGTKFKVFDDGQSCCEDRYMRTDDDLAYYVGAQLLGVEVSFAPNETDEYGLEHEVQFVKMQTSKGVFTLANHNEHNGYYGGFLLRAEVE